MIDSETRINLGRPSKSSRKQWGAPDQEIENKRQCLPRAYLSSIRCNEIRYFNIVENMSMRYVSLLFWQSPGCLCILTDDYDGL